MKKFSELGVTVQDERKMFNCSQVSILWIRSPKTLSLSALRLKG